MSISAFDEKEDNPLVSVIVITYNSSKYVLETLDSIKDQSYKNIELIISDDCSSDDTLRLIEDWLAKNGNRFDFTKVLRTPVNTGIAPNCNRGLFASKGEWVKLIAGDDMLLPNAIEKLVEFALEDEVRKVIFGRIQYLKNNELTDDTIPEIFQLTQDKQIAQNLKGSQIKAPSSFINRNVLVDLGGFDERFPMIEDVPLWIKLSSSGYRFHFVDENIAKYRIHDENISMRTKKNLVFIRESFYRQQEQIYKKIIIPELIRKKQLFDVILMINYMLVMRLILLLGNKNTTFIRMISMLDVNNQLKIIKKISLNFLIKTPH